ncbi:Membrane carboxypeptidase (penicillin-binding protein) [Mycetocola miduiensis]|uniref:Membrane carboxypeptidase (Penicillin-binding protein) n=2 Tax=Mycetocola miduiensis TaxID=995034 RepID=A0A1I4ZFU3_9MICO|nr:Membrane carboxypeptidase (penicillin-binding protein) [Mycetocola miduiensis]
MMPPVQEGSFVREWPDRGLFRTFRSFFSYGEWMSSRRRTLRTLPGHVLGFLLLSLIAGVLVSAGVTPAVVVAAEAADTAAQTFEKLPGSLEIGQPMEKTRVWAVGNDGNPVQLAAFFEQNRVEVGADEMSPFVKDAAVAAEDPRFPDHGGVDVIGTLRAILSTYILGGPMQGGSTITQQYVKNVLIQNCEASSDGPVELQACAQQATTTAGSDGAARKLKEMRLAVGLEKRYSKADILTGYLNIANFGARTYGVQAAAQYYFGVDASALRISQAAVLVSILNNPNVLRIDRPESAVNGEANGYALTRERRDYVIAKMAEQGKISQAEGASASSEPVLPAINPPSTGCDSAAGASYFCDYVTWAVKKNPAFGSTSAERAETLRRGGLNIYTTLDLDLQAATEQGIASRIPFSLANTDIGTAAVTVEPGTGRILAMAQNKNFSNDATLAAADNSNTAINYSTDRGFGGSSGFQIGSTFKVFILMEWLKQGHSLNELVDGSRRTFTRWHDSCTGDHRTSYRPKNYDGTSPGAITPLQATKRSVNTAFIAMAQQLDLCAIFDGAEKMGVHRADGEPLDRYPAALLGANEIAPLSLATAIAGIAASGLVCQPTAIDRVVGPAGKEIPLGGHDCVQAVTPRVAHAASYAMGTVFERGGTAARAAVPGAPLMGKTGTADRAVHSWITGGTTEAITSLWVGNVSGSDSMYTVRPLGEQTAYSAKFGIFADILKTSIAKFGGTSFGEPDPEDLEVSYVRVPQLSGQDVSTATRELIQTGLAVVVGNPVESARPEGTVARTVPAAGKYVRAGGTVTLHPSDGAANDPPAPAPVPTPAPSPAPTPTIGPDEGPGAGDAG